MQIPKETNSATQSPASAHEPIQGRVRLLQVKILEPVPTGRRRVLIEGRAALIPDHPAFQKNQILDLVWNAEIRRYEPAEQPAANTRSESGAQHLSQESSSPPGFSHESSLPFPDDPASSWGAPWPEPRDDSSERPPSGEELAEVECLLEVLRWASFNLRPHQGQTRWVQLPVHLEDRPSWRIRALFLWNGDVARILKAGLEVRREDGRVKSWWFLTDPQGKWYIVDDAGTVSGSHSIDFYL